MQRSEPSGNDTWFPFDPAVNRFSIAESASGGPIDRLEAAQRQECSDFLDVFFLAFFCLEIIADVFHLKGTV